MRAKGMAAVAFFCAVCSAVLSESGAAPSTASDPLEEYNVVWQTPSVSSSGSMPIGNGDIGLNVWVEENGDLLLYIVPVAERLENSNNVSAGFWSTDAL